MAGHAAERASSHWPLILAGIYCVGVVLASLAGGWLPLFIRMTHTRLQLSMSLCGGLMLGIGLLHLLPHAFAVLESLDRAVLWMMAGLLTMFFLIRAFHFHQHEPSPSQTASEPNPHEHHGTSTSTVMRIITMIIVIRPSESSWIGVALGLGIHTLIEGMALAASVQVEAAQGGMGLLGSRDISRRSCCTSHSMPFRFRMLMQARQIVEPLRHISSMLHLPHFVPLGVALFFLGFERFTRTPVGHCRLARLAFSAGVFLCISLADLLPELEFHSHDRLKLSLALLNRRGDRVRNRLSRARRGPRSRA